MYRTEPRSAEIEREEQMRDLTVREDAMRYLRAHKVLTELRYEFRRNTITRQQYRTLRGQAVAGDLDGALKGLARIMAR